MTPIMGQSLVTVDQCENFIRTRNSNAPYLATIYKKYCDRYGIRLECAWVQMCLETNFLKYSDTSITTLDMHNYAGLGAVDGNGRRQALSFDTEDEGVKCHIQHLYAYCSTNPIPDNDTLIDPRFNYVTRGIAPNIENLGNGNWASDKEYASKLLNLLNILLQTNNNSNNQGDDCNMSKIISYDFGHMEGGADTSANGIVYEYAEIRKYAPICIKVLENAGYTCINCTPSDGSGIGLTESLVYRVNKANASGSILHLCFHVNAFDGNAHGAEIEVASDTGERYGQSVLNEICNLGFTRRGINRPNLYVTRHTNMPAILVEPFFCDSQQDCNIYNPVSLGNAIAKGILNVLGGTYNPINSNITSSPSTSSDLDFIKSVQHDLQRVSCLANGEENADGIVGNMTKAAIKQFRYIVDLPDSNAIDSSLINDLNAITKKPTIGYGWASNPIATKFVQWYLGISPKSGVFNSDMTSKVKDWQIKSGIWSASGADGVIREKDWNVILK